MKYYVTFSIDARYIAKVEADSVEEAIDEARLRFYDADFGEAEDINGKELIVEDERGEFVWER